MKRLVIFSALAASVGLTGCVTTTGPASSQGDQNPVAKSMADAMSQFRVPSVFGGMAPVALNMKADVQPYFTDKGQLSELFAKFKLAPRGTDQYRFNSELAGKIGGMMAQNKGEETYIYIDPTHFRDPIVVEFVSLVEARGGKGRVMAKADLRMRGAESALIWTRDPLLAQDGDALISADKHGLLAKQ